MSRGLVIPVTPDECARRAITSCVVPTDYDARTWYKVGAGGKYPDAITCATIEREVDAKGRRCFADCVGFAMWCYGRDRCGADMKWWNQNSVHADAKKAAESGRPRTWRFCAPYAGCIALIVDEVIGNDKRTGHMGIVTEVVDGKVVKVAHCSPSLHTEYKQGIAETTQAQAFGTKRVVYYVEATP